MFWGGEAGTEGRYEGLTGLLTARERKNKLVKQQTGREKSTGWAAAAGISEGRRGVGDGRGVYTST